jgi:FixJ family two-component response regulator
MAPLQRIVYVVADDPANRRTLEQLLNATDFPVVLSVAPRALLKVAATLSAGCVLLDIV